MARLRHQTIMSMYYYILYNMYLLGIFTPGVFHIVYISYYNTWDCQLQVIEYSYFVCIEFKIRKNLMRHIGILPFLRFICFG